MAYDVIIYYLSCLIKCVLHESREPILRAWSLLVYVRSQGTFLGCLVYSGSLDGFIASQKNSTLNHPEFTLSNGSVAKQQFLERECYPPGIGMGLFCGWLLYLLLPCC